MSNMLAVAGAIIALFGIVFALQGQGILGPPQSFMVNNPRWITYGSILIILGMIMTLGSTFSNHESKKG